jgi:hypothetical protein
LYAAPAFQENRTCVTSSGQSPIRQGGRYLLLSPGNGCAQRDFVQLHQFQQHLIGIALQIEVLREGRLGLLPLRFEQVDVAPRFVPASTG